MSGQKRAVALRSKSKEGVEPRSKKGRVVSVSTVEKWQKDFNRKFDSLVWLRCTRSKSDDHEKLVNTLWRDICKRFEGNIRGLKNFSDAWIKGSKNHKTSNVQDHAYLEQH